MVVVLLHVVVMVVVVFSNLEHIVPPNKWLHRMVRVLLPETKQRYFRERNYYDLCVN